MINNPQIGMRVQYICPLFPERIRDIHCHPYHNHIGTIIALRIIGEDALVAKVEFDIIPTFPGNTKRKDVYAHNLMLAFSSPEEEAEWKEKCRQNKERQLDQQRREDYAKKYL